MAVVVDVAEEEDDAAKLILKPGALVTVMMMTTMMMLMVMLMIRTMMKNTLMLNKWHLWSLMSIGMSWSPLRFSYFCFHCSAANLKTIVTVVAEGFGVMAT